MILGNPWALAGLALIALPVIIHLLDRHHARVLRFPSLRFLPASRLTPVRRMRPSDLLLLLIRCGIVAAIVVALARPMFESAARAAERDRTIGRLLARAIVIDTSHSMRRLALRSDESVVATAMDHARARASQLAMEASSIRIIETSNPQSVLDGASQWLSGQRGRRELVVISDFQLGVVDSASLGVIPSSIGIRLSRLTPFPDTALRARAGGRDARVTLSGERTDVVWDAATGAAAVGPVLLAGIGDQDAVQAASNAARAFIGAGTVDPRRPVAIIYKGYGRRAELARVAKPVNEPWMGDAIARLHSDATLVSGASLSGVSSDSLTGEPPFSVILRNENQQPVVLASHGNVGGRDGLQLWLLADAQSMTSAALMAAVPGAVSPAVPTDELEPRSLDAEALSRLERQPAPAEPRRDVGDESDGRWLWLAALLLLGVETMVRRRARDPHPARVTSPDRGDDERMQHVA